MLLAVLAALAAPLLAPYDPLSQNLGNTLARPGRAHLLGTDNVGRDVLSRVIWGTRVSLVAGLVSVALAMVAGSLLGILAGYCGGRVDGLAMRLMDAVLSFPPLVLALALGAVLQASGRQTESSEVLAEAVRAFDRKGNLAAASQARAMMRAARR